MSRTRKDERLLLVAADGTPTAAERAELEQRLRADPAVRRARELDRTLVEGLRALPLEEPPRDLVGAAAAHFAREQRLTALAWRPWLALAVAAVVTVVGVSFFWRAGLLGRPGTTRPAPTVPEALLASAVQGTVWLQDGAGRRRARGGDTVTAGARLESEADGRVTLSRSANASVTLYEDSVVEVTGEGGGATWRLERGVLRAESFEAAVPLVLEVRGVGSRVEVRQGVVGVLAHADSGMTVACTAGRVELVGADSRVTLSAGQQVVADSRGRTVREAIPETSLEVTPVGPVPAGVREVELSGVTRPGVSLLVDGRAVAVDERGHFSARLPFSGEARRVVVRVRDALARTRETSVALAPAPRHRAPGLETQWEWEQARPGPG